MKVKGSWLKEHVEMIRQNMARKDEFDKYLLPEDWEIINNKVLVSSWFPLESYKRMGGAVFQVLAQGNLKLAQVAGRYLMQELLKTYPNILVSADPKASLRKLILNQSTFFRNIESKISFQREETCLVEIKLIMPGEIFTDPIALPFAHQLGGKMEELVKKSGGKNTLVEVIKNSKDFTFRLSWH